MYFVREITFRVVLENFINIQMRNLWSRRMALFLALSLKKMGSGFFWLSAQLSWLTLSPSSSSAVERGTKSKQQFLTAHRLISYFFSRIKIFFRKTCIKISTESVHSYKDYKNSSSKTEFFCETYGQKRFTARPELQRQVFNNLADLFCEKKQRLSFIIFSQTHS